MITEKWAIANNEDIKVCNSQDELITYIDELWHLEVKSSTIRWIDVIVDNKGNFVDFK